MKHIVFCFFVFVLLSTVCFAQDDGQWTHYPITGELDLGYVTALTTDKNGVLWAGTHDGLYRFDGKNWEHFSFEEIGAVDFITSLVVDDGNTLHLAAASYNTFRDNAWSGIPYRYNPTVIAIAPNGDAWFGASAGVLRYDGSSWDEYLVENGVPAREVESIAVDLSNNIWCGTLQEGLLRFDGDNWTQFTEEDGLGGNFDIIVRITPDGTVWCAGKKIGKYGVTGVWMARYLGENDWMLIENSVQIDILEVDSNGIMWASNFEELFASYDGIKWTKYNIPDIDIQSLAVDSNGVVWIGTYEDGIYRFDPNPTSVEENTPFPIQVSIKGNYPNPFNGSTLISFYTPMSAFCELSIYSMNGQLIRQLVSKNINQGRNQVYWNGKDAIGQTAASGVYLIRLQSEFGSDFQKITFTK